MTNRSTRRTFIGIALVLSVGACAMQRPSMERILQEGDCANVPDIDQLAITVSDHGAKVLFRWSGERFAGTVQTSTDALAKDASFGENRPGEWERRFPGMSATGTVEGSYLGFPAFSSPGAGVLAASVYETPYPAPADLNRGLAIVNLKTNGTLLLPASRRIASVVISPQGDYLAVVEVAPATTMGSWRDLFGLQRNAESPRFGLYATVYSTAGLVGCTRDLVTGVPSPAVNVAWRP